MILNVMSIENTNILKETVYLKNSSIKVVALTVISILGREWQVDLYEFKDSFICTVNSKPVRIENGE